MKYRGSCHCGNVAYEVEGTLDGAMACNCSICQRKGSLLWFVPHDRFTLRTPDENAATYKFNKHVIVRMPRASIPKAIAWPRSTCAASRTSTSSRYLCRNSTGVRRERL